MSRARYEAAVRAHQELVRGPLDVPLPPIPVAVQLLINQGLVTEDAYYAHVAEELEEVVRERSSLITKCPSCGQMGSVFCLNCGKEYPK